MLGFLITVILALLVIGVLLWGIEHFPWIDPSIRQAIKVLVVVVVALWLIATLIGAVPVYSPPLFRR